jgi:hypothetical protein
LLAGIAETICVSMSMYNTELPLPSGVVVPYSEISVDEKFQEFVSNIAIKKYEVNKLN